MKTAKRLALTVACLSILGLSLCFFRYTVAWSPDHTCLVRLDRLTGRVSVARPGYDLVWSDLREERTTSARPEGAPSVTLAGVDHGNSTTNRGFEWVTNQ